MFHADSSEVLYRLLLSWLYVVCLVLFEQFYLFIEQFILFEQF